MSIYSLIRQEVLVACRQASDIFMPLIYFLMILLLLPLAAGTHLQIFAPAFIWIAMLLAIFLALNKLFRDEYHEGSLEQLLITESLAFVLLIKIAVHWLLTLFPLLLFIPFTAILFDLPLKMVMLIELTLLLGTPTLILIGAMASALTIGLRNQSILIIIVILPLFLPVLIFAMGCVDAYQADLACTGQLALLAAMLVVTILIAPFATAAALRVMIN